VVKQRVDLGVQSWCLISYLSSTRSSVLTLRQKAGPGSTVLAAS
jgi:hypothetical protein